MCIRANITNIEIPEETSLFAEFKTLTENVHERCSSDLGRAADWRRTVQWKEEGAQEQKEPHYTTCQKSSNELEKEKQQETWTRT